MSILLDNYAKLGFYEKNEIICLLNPEPPSPASLIIAPKQPIPIIEQINDDTFGKMFVAATKLGVISAQATGTNDFNILVQNGEAAGQKTGHASINVITRRKDDGINLSWNPGQTNEAELNSAEELLLLALSKTAQKQELPAKQEKKTADSQEESQLAHYYLNRIP